MKISVEKPSKEMIEKAKKWPIWSCDVSEFDYFYDELETCLILEGEVEVTTKEGITKFKSGDLVTFPKGLSCKWKVLKPVKKHYNFG